MKKPMNLAITVNLSDRISMERRLDAAVAIARRRTMEEGRQGILVTRNGFGSFTVALSDAVPFGVTLEQELVE